jgi:hypothetical protein
MPGYRVKKEDCQDTGCKKEDYQDTELRKRTARIYSVTCKGRGISGRIQHRSILKLELLAKDGTRASAHSC